MKRTGEWVEVANGSVLRELITSVTVERTSDDGKYRLAVRTSEGAWLVGNFSKPIAIERMRRITGGKGLS